MVGRRHGALTNALMPPPVMASATPTPDGAATKKPDTRPASVPRDSISSERSSERDQDVCTPQGPKKGAVACSGNTIQSGEQSLVQGATTIWHGY